MTVNEIVVVRGGGDLATGTIYKLAKCGYPVLVLEIESPSAIRRNVAFCEAVYEGKKQVEDMICQRVESLEEAYEVMEKGSPALLVDPDGDWLQGAKPHVLVDAILAKKNLGTTKTMADYVIALGPGFTAGEDCDAVIETKRGHRLGRVIYEGKAIANTGVPGNIGGFTKERVIHSPAEGIYREICPITSLVEKGQVIAEIEMISGEKCPVEATLTGLLRGSIRDGYPVTKGFKIADIDPRAQEYENCFTISDKARCIAGGVLEAILAWESKR